MLENKYQGGHSLISPSGASKWSACSASVRLTMNEENKTNPMAERGTNIHWLGELMLKGREDFIENSSVIKEDGKGMFYANKDMIDEARAYNDYVRALATKPDAEIIAEAKVDCVPEHDITGHVDATVINGSTLHIVDLKTGRGAVSAEENLQMQLYALGCLREHEMFYDFDEVVLHVVQDNAMIHNTNSWSTTPEDLADFETWVTERARLALQEDSICTPSESACKWCSHAPKCEALFKEASDALDFENLDSKEAIVGNSEIIDIKDVIDFVSKRGLIDIAFKAYESRIMDELKAGKEVEGYKAIKTVKRKAWISEMEAYEKIKTWLPLDDVAPRKLATPTQVGKMLNGSSTRKLNLFAELWETPEGEIKLVKSSQRGEALKFEQFKDLDS